MQSMLSSAFLSQISSENMQKILLPHNMVPSVLLNSLSSWLWRKRQYSKLPLLGDYLDLGCESGSEWGIYRIGEVKKTYGIAGKPRIVIYWPVFFRNVGRFVTVDNLFPLFRLAFAFMPLVGFYSYTWKELLIRSLEQKYNISHDPARVIPVAASLALNTDEEECLEELTTRFLGTPAFIQTLSASFDATYKSYVLSPGYKTRLLENTQFRSEEVSILSSEKIKTYRDCLEHVSIVFAKNTKRFPLKPTEVVAELMYAAHFRKKELGVEFYRVPKGDEDNKHQGCLVIDLARYSEYRKPFTPFYKRYFSGSVNEGKRNYINYQQIFGEQCSRLTYPSGPVIFRDEVKRSWPGVDLNTVFFVSWGSLLESSAVAAAASYKWYTAVKNLGRSTSYKVRKPKVWNLAMPRFSGLDVDNQVLSFQFLKHANEVYFNPPWKVYRGDTAQTIRGIYCSRLLDNIFYSYEYLKHHEHDEFGKQNSLLHQIPDLDEWLKNTADILKKKRYKDYMNFCRKTMIQNLNRLGRNALYGITYTREEDAAITRLLRPGMQEEDKIELSKICVGRKWKAILVRAKTLRDAMISSGIFDMGKLPYLNYHKSIFECVDVEQRKRRRALNKEISVEEAPVTAEAPVTEEAPVVEAKIND